MRLKHKFALMLGVLAMLAFTPKTANACCSCAVLAGGTSLTQWAISIPAITGFVDAELDAQEDWLLETVVGDKILPAMKMMADQLTATAMQQVLAVGMFFDAKHQMETQRLLQTLQAKAVKDYHPSAGMCTFGSSVKSLASSERKGEVNTIFLSQRSLDRQLGNSNTVAAFGPGVDVSSRVKQFKNVYCDPNNNNGSLESYCGSGGDDSERFNRDIDYARMVDQPWSLDVDFTNSGDPTDDEEDILALASNLYAFDVFQRFEAKDLSFDPEASKLRDAQKDLMNVRALVAKRSVAENSFNNIAGMKSAGSGGSTQFLQAIIKELGITDDGDLKELLGENPSYHAQMEVLTKKLYQNPDFYTNLYDKPANVQRKGVALQAIGLMQKFDMLDSALRQEASLSVLLEVAVDDMQASVENRPR